MLRWALVFFCVALVAGLLGLAGIAEGAAWVAKTLFFLFMAAFVICFVTGWSRRGRPPRPIL
jgi:uncharacterized membrane protein YtjA (UPF0391 family)